MFLVCEAPSVPNVPLTSKETYNLFEIIQVDLGRGVALTAHSNSQKKKVKILSVDGCRRCSLFLKSHHMA